MSFKSLAPYKMARSDGKVSIAVQQKQIAIRIGPVILEQLGWEAGTCIDVQVGDGDDFGVVRLAKNPAGWSLQKQGGQSGRGIYVVLRLQKIVLGKPSLPQVPDRLKFTPIDVKVIGGQVEFRLPWILRFVADNLTVRPNGAGRIDKPATYVGTIANS